MQVITGVERRWVCSNLSKYLNKTIHKTGDIFRTGSVNLHFFGNFDNLDQYVPYNSEKKKSKIISQDENAKS